MPSTDWKEVITPGEAERLEALAAELAAMQAKRIAKNGAERALHEKQHGAFEATLEVLPDVAPWARVGIFATPGPKKAFVRCSNGMPGKKKDGVDDLRGFAVKVLDVPGEKLIPPLKDATTQDFLTVNVTTVPFATPEQFIGFVTAAEEGPLSLLRTLLFRFGPVQSFGLLRRAAAWKIKSPPTLVACKYNSVVPVKWGNYAVRYGFFPVTVPEPTRPVADGRDRLRDDLQARLERGPWVLEMRVQGFEDEASTPIEDGTRDWTAPWTPVARLTVHPPGDRREAIEADVAKMSFDPWHAPIEFRPLGLAMRARNPAYRESTKQRGASPEPSARVDG
jgi:hypothetical protein